MKKIGLLAIWIAVYGTSLGPVLAQESDDGSAVADKRHGIAAVSVHDATELVVERYLVTYLKSRTDAPRSATVVTVTNQSNKACEVKIDWFTALIPGTPTCSTIAVLDAGLSHDFCSRGLLTNITTCNSVCEPELAFIEGKVIVSSSEPCNRIGVESRVYYTTGETSDTGIAAVSNPKIVKVGQGNRGD